VSDSNNNLIITAAIEEMGPNLRDVSQAAEVMPAMLVAEAPDTSRKRREGRARTGLGSPPLDGMIPGRER
jgi:hypothetical protein